MQNGHISYWLSRPDAPQCPVTETLIKDDSVDVAIVGGGLTGMWTAWALKQRDPSLSVAVLEAEHIGYGASGRFLGWLSAKEVGARKVYAQSAGREAILELERQLVKAMDDSVEILGAQEIRADRGGWLKLARSASEQARLDGYLAECKAYGVGDTQVEALDARQAYDRVRMTRLTGALYFPDMYSVDPARMIFRLARLVLDAGVTVYTHSRVDTVTPGEVRVGSRTVKAKKIVVATEGYTRTLPGHRRQIIPLNAAAVVTEPLTDDQWDAIGWKPVCGISAMAHTYFSGNRTFDGRILFGGRGRPYRFGSDVGSDGLVDQRSVDKILADFADCFPQISVQPAHAWCGVLGVSRDWSPFIEFDSTSSILQVGAYFGTGTTATHLAGKIAADLILGRRTDLTNAPWIRPSPRNWEPEPLRWVGATGLFGVYKLADWMEGKFQMSKTSTIASLADKITGR